MKLSTSLGYKYPLPSLSQQLKIAFAEMQAISLYEDFLLFFYIKSIYYSIEIPYNFNSYNHLDYQLQQPMSKSVRSYASSSNKGKASQGSSAQHVKEKIKEILYSIKEERQHIQNRLYENDIEIDKLRKDYQLLRYDHDFEHLNEEQTVFVQELKEGLRQNNINPQVIMGGVSHQTQQFRDLSKQEVIEVQQILINQLKSMLKQ